MMLGQRRRLLARSFIKKLPATNTVLVRAFSAVLLL